MTMDSMLVAGLCVGVIALFAGELLRHRRIRAEHWLWKKRRLRRARILMAGGTTMSVVSAAAIVVI
jgi:hypothetical protein